MNPQYWTFQISMITTLRTSKIEVISSIILGGSCWKLRNKIRFLLDASPKTQNFTLLWTKTLNPHRPLKKLRREGEPKLFFSVGWDGGRSFRGMLFRPRDIGSTGCNLCPWPRGAAFPHTPPCTRISTSSCLLWEQTKRRVWKCIDFQIINLLVFKHRFAKLDFVVEAGNLHKIFPLGSLIKTVNNLVKF